MHCPTPKLPPTHHPVITAQINSWLDPSKQSSDTFFISCSYRTLIHQHEWSLDSPAQPNSLCSYRGSSKQIAGKLYSVPPSFLYWSGHQSGDLEISHETLPIFHKVLEKLQNYLFHFQKIHTLCPALFLPGHFTFLFSPSFFLFFFVRVCFVFWFSFFF